MAMTLRLDEEETATLARLAESEGRSQNDIVRAAIREYAKRNGENVEISALLDELTPRWRNVLDRLGE